jgi:hypothetical protein
VEGKACGRLHFIALREREREREREKNKIKKNY